MTLLNPSGAPLRRLTFTRLGAVSGTTDALGNAVQTTTTVTVDAVVTPLGQSRLADLAPAVGVDGGGIPVKVRVAAWPKGVAAQQPAIASLTCNGRPATLRLTTIREQNPHALALTPEIGQSAEGVLVLG